jgi:hypothetical protein
MKKLTIAPFAAMLALALAALPAKADGTVEAFYSGNLLFAACSTQSSTHDSGLCRGYITGVVDMVSTVAAAFSSTGAPVAYCYPNGVTTGQIRDVVIQRLQAHPEERRYPAAGIILTAITEAFPCARKRS